MGSVWAEARGSATDGNVEGATRGSATGGNDGVETRASAIAGGRVLRRARRMMWSLELADSSDANGASTEIRSAMLAKRSSRDLARHRITACSSATGKSGRKLPSG